MGAMEEKPWVRCGFAERSADTGGFDAAIPQSASLTVACGQPGRGSGCPPDSHSLPRLRFAYPLHKGAFGRSVSAPTYTPGVRQENGWMGRNL